jgi:hypothetical protein
LELALFWTGCAYNFCHSHVSLDGSPAMAADITDHVCSIEEVIHYRCHHEYPQPVLQGYHKNNTGIFYEATLKGLYIA